jgi:TonB-linked SusC/RagA family outer membrane protein
MPYAASSASCTVRHPTVAGIEVEPRLRRSRPPSPRRRAMLAAWAALVLAALGAAPTVLRAQENVVAGTVVTERSDRPIPGAQVYVQGDVSKGVIADASGRFRIAGLSGATVTLNVRMIGYRAISQSVRVGTMNVRFAMSERAVELDQVVVTGTAGGQQQRAIGNSVARVDAANVVATAPVNSMQDLINGRAPGVVVMPGTGMVGAGSKIRIRGMSSFSLSGDPLIYVDGVRVNNETGSGLAVQAFGAGVVSRLNDFNPEEIASIEILKGPAAATLYGTEAARGVINIITKRGAASGTQYAFTVKQGSNWFQDAANRVPTNYWRDPSGVVQSVNVYQTEAARGTPIFRTGQLRGYSANVSGGANALRYFASADVNNDQGIEPNNERRQFSGRTNLSIAPNSKVDLQTSLGYVNSHTSLSCEGGCGGATWGAWYSTPANLPQNCGAADTACAWARGFNSSPPEVDRAMQDWQDVTRMTGSAAVSFQPFAWMKHRLSIGTDFTQEKNEELLPYLTNDTLRFYWGQNADGWKYQNRREIVYNSYDYVGSLIFNPTSSLNSTTSAGTQYYQKHISYITAEGDHFPAPGLETVTGGSTKSVTEDGIQDSRTLGFYVQQQFGWQDRLFLTGAVRVDNNSAFGKDIKWVTYPKASLSWVLNEEPLFKQYAPSLLSTMKLRTAYGQSGQQPDIFTALRTLRPVPGSGTGALTPQFYGNPNLGPERGAETEVGFDAGFFNDRIGLDFTYYHTRTRDAILSRPVAPSTGFGANNQFVNAGAILNTGVEALIKASILSSPRFGWDVNLNLSKNNGKVERLNGTDTTIVVGSLQHRVGYAPWSFFRERVVSADYDPVTKKAINAMCDDGKGGSTPCFNANGAVIAPRVYLGRAVPDFEGSFSSTVRLFERFRFNGMLDFKSGYKKTDNNLRIRCQIFNTCLERVYPETTDPKALAGMQTNGTIVDWAISDARYMKLRELSLTYDLPELYLRRFGARSSSVSVAARNLHTWTPYSGLDPESQFLGASLTTPQYLDQAQLPQLTSWVVTMHLTY